MAFEMYGDVILTRDVPESSLRAGDALSVSPFRLLKLQRHPAVGTAPPASDIERE